MAATSTQKTDQQAFTFGPLLLQGASRRKGGDMKSSEALRIARGKLAAGGGFGICCQLPGNSAGNRVADRICKSIDWCGYVEFWLHRQGIPWSQLRATEMRAYRLRWIDWMIIGYEAIGD